MRKPIPGFSNYTISSTGRVYNSNGVQIKQRIFKNTRYVRLYKNGKRYTLSVNKLLFKEFDLVDKHINLDNDEIGIRYEDSHYYLTNMGRCYNAKTCNFLNPIIRNGYKTFNIYLNNGKRKVVYPIGYIKKSFYSEVC